MPFCVHPLRVLPDHLAGRPADGKPGWRCRRRWPRQPDGLSGAPPPLSFTLVVSASGTIAHLHREGRGPQRVLPVRQGTPPCVPGRPGRVAPGPRSAQLK